MQECSHLHDHKNYTLKPKPGGFVKRRSIRMYVTFHIAAACKTPG